MCLDICFYIYHTCYTCITVVVLTTAGITFLMPIFGHQTLSKKRKKKKTGASTKKSNETHSAAGGMGGVRVLECVSMTYILSMITLTTHHYLPHLPVAPGEDWTGVWDTCRLDRCEQDSCRYDNCWPCSCRLDNIKKENVCMCDNSQLGWWPRE